MSKRANGEGTCFRRQDGRWQGQHTVTGPLGQSLRKTVYGKTQAEVRQKLRALQDQAAAGVVALGRPPRTLSALGQQWLNTKLVDDVAQGHLAGGTRTNYRNIWTTHIEPDLGHLRLDQLTPQRLRPWLTSKASQHSRRGRPLSGRTQQLIYAVLRKALNDAVTDGLLPANPLRSVRAPRASRSSASPLGTAEVCALLAVARADRIYPLLLLMLATGARPGEALAAAWSQMDLETGTWRIDRTLTRHEDDEGRTTLGFKKTKTPTSEATVSLPAVAVAELRRHRTHQAVERLAAPGWADPDLVFTTRLGTPLESRNVLRRLKELATSAGIARNVRLHDLRHTAASSLLAEGVDITVTSKLLRHSRLATTSDIYSHLLPEVRDGAAEVMSQRLTRLLS